MSFRSSSDSSASELNLPADVHWDMLDKSKFFIFGAALFSGVSATLYPVMVLKTRQQVSSSSSSSLKLCCNIVRHEGMSALYKGFTTSLIGTIPARILYMSTLEITKSTVGEIAMDVGLSTPSALATANAVGGLTASVAAQLVWTPVDVISQRLMVQGSFHAGKHNSKESSNLNSVNSSTQRGNATFRYGTMNYNGGLDAFRSIVRTNGLQGLYRGFGMSILTYAPSNALWWASYSLAQRGVWGSLGYSTGMESDIPRPSTGLVMGVQGASAACAGGITAFLTAPLDTVKTRLQVLGGAGNEMPTLKETIVSLVKEGGWRACYRGVGPRWAMMAMSATTMITTYEFLKRLSKKQGFGEGA